MTNVKEMPAPKDRPIWICANIACKEECFTSVQPYEGYAAWNEKSKDWQDLRGMSIRVDYDAEFIPLEWMELADRAVGSPESESAIDANVYFWDEQWRRDDGTAGFFALCSIWHSLTGVHLVNRTAGPFPTRSMAIAALNVMLSEITQPEAVVAA